MCATLHRHDRGPLVATRPAARIAARRSRLRIDFLPTPLAGHVNPTLSVARALVASGERVVYRLPEPFRAAVEATGGELDAIRFPPVLSAGGAGGSDEQEDPLTTLALTPLQMTRACVSVLPQILDVLEDDPPDVLVYDSLSVWGRLAAQRIACAAAICSASYAVNDTFSYLLAPGEVNSSSPRMREAVADFAADMQVLAGTYDTPRLSPRELLHHAEPLTLVFVARAWQPRADSFDERYRFVGPAPRDSVPGSLDAELRSFLEARAPVFGSLGTRFHRWPAFTGLCARAAGEARVPLLIAGGDPLPPAADLLHRASVEQPAVLDHSRAFITHGGMSGVTEALARSVPMVLIPQMPEQRLTAERVASAGAGLILERDGLDAGALCDAVRTVVTDPRFAASAARIWDELGGGAGPAGARAADALRAYARATGGPAA
jgi:MGT family glycosyltransferase